MRPRLVLVKSVGSPRSKTFFILSHRQFHRVKIRNNSYNLPPMDLLTNRLGVFLYIILRNDWSWSLLSERDRALVFRANQSHNTGREDYANPDLYGGVRMEG